MTKSRNIHDMHGKHDTRAYGVWSSMRSRCNNPNEPAFPNYGARGITVCERWSQFSNFYADMGEPPLGMTLEREDNDRGYSKENCIWADRTTQGRNKRNNVLLTIDGETQPMSVWAERAGIKYATVHQRIAKGWTHEEAVKAPLVKNRAGIKRGAKIHKSEAALILYAGEKMTLHEAARRSGLAFDTVDKRIRKGWPVAYALSEPARRGPHKKFGANHGVVFRDLESMQ
jgi:hypothetical protein